MSQNFDQSFWLRELAKTGLPAAGQKELLTSLTKAVGDREYIFPTEPSQYVRRIRQLLSAAFLPQQGPLFVAKPSEPGQELLSRCQCWELLHLEFSLLDGTHRPIEGVHEAITELIALLTSSEFPLSIPPRWLVELFSDLSRMASLRMEKNGWKLRPTATLDLASQAYLDAVLCNLENDKRRNCRQLVDFTCGDTEELADASRQALLPPAADAIVPPLPPGFPLDHRPRFWMSSVRVDTPKRDREEDDSSSESGGIRRDPKRPAPEMGDTSAASDRPPLTSGYPHPIEYPPPLTGSDAAPGTQANVVPGDALALRTPATVNPPALPIASPYGTAPCYPRVHYSLSSIMRNPLRSYPSSVTLYKSTLPDHTLLDLPVFQMPFGVGMSSKVFKRGDGDPAMSIVSALEFKRVRADTLSFLTWNEQLQQPAPFCPFANDAELFHVFELPKRRVAPGKDLHGWSLGIRLGEKASGAWANQVTDKVQPLPPPVLRKINWRELMEILRAPKQLGLPASTNTDSKLGWAVYSYMAPEVLLDLCEGSQSILLRIEGYSTRGHDSKELAQKAKVGVCPCCARATHVLIPPTYSVGKSDRKKQNSILLWQRHGPYATRNYAAALYANANGILPDSWDWIASKHILRLPSPLNPEDISAPPVEVGDESMGLPFGLSQDRPSLASPSGDSSVPKKVPKPPPPVHKGGARVSPSPAKSRGAVQGSSSRAGSPWRSDWHSTSSQARDWQQRRWYK